VFAAILAAATYQGLSDRRDLSAFPPPGRLIDVGGRRLHLYCIGVGSPTVVLESGLGSPSPVWSKIQAQVAPRTRVCAYDRAGTAWSDACPGSRDPARIAEELKTLLDDAGVEGPFVLVGHSFGGLYARAFQNLFPERVTGLVLLDATHEDYFTRTAEGRAEYKSLLATYRVIDVVAPLGLTRIGPQCDLPAGSSAQARAQFRALCVQTGAWWSAADELRAVTTPLPQPRDRLALRSLPVAVVTAGESLRQTKHWRVFQDELAAMSDRSIHIVVERANHSSLLLDTAGAQTSAEAILEVVDLARTSHPPSPQRLGEAPGGARQ
jgi:pimeloyl-ACP methyl ester carboxylesterase